jgi:hypothetical protein
MCANEEYVLGPFITSVCDKRELVGLMSHNFAQGVRVVALCSVRGSTVNWSEAVQDRGVSRAAALMSIWAPFSRGHLGRAGATSSPHNGHRLRRETSVQRA